MSRIRSFFLRNVNKRDVRHIVPPPDIPALGTALDLLPFSFDLPPRPHVSIVIPFHGRPELTVRCLYGLRHHRTDHAFEVILVDDGSGPTSRAVVDQVRGTRVVRHDVALGFAAACNAGAAQARGQFVLFMNNDTFALPGLLDELVMTFTLFPQAGVVGSALIYPDGRLQEAGALVWNNAAALNIGRDQDPDDPDFSFTREVDYCSGACLMIRRELFERLGGFDRRYDPAYYEDTDLCLRVAESGHRVLAQPLARLVHVEGGTTGSDPDRSVKRFQALNRVTFQQRWGERLRRAPAPVAFGVSQFRLPGQRRIIIVDHVLPAIDQDAGSVILLEIIRVFQRLGYHLILGALQHPTHRDERVRTLERLGIEIIRAPYYRSALEFMSVHDGQFDLLFMVRYAVAEQILPHLDRLAARPPTILLNADLHYLRVEREAAVHGDAALAARAARDKVWELDVIRRVGAVITHSEAECAILRAEVPEKFVAVLPWIARAAGSVPPFEARRNLLFVGSFAHLPNTDAIVHFVERSWPSVRARLPAVGLRIVGSQIGERIARLAGDGVEIVGHVKHLRDELDLARIAIAPLRWGAGLKGKVATAIAAGLPNVISPIAAEGMGLIDGETCLIADLGAPFVEVVERLYNSPALWRSLSENGSRLAENRWSPEQAETNLAGILQRVGVAPSFEVSDRIETAVKTRAR